jgi:NAD(P)-dependent dehydrogenase (short-subunit alcohol dehydrogenase family)
MAMTGSRQVVVVTGASAGIGRATVREFARHGADIALLARGEEGLRAAAAEVGAAGRRALVIAVDVADHQAVDRAAARIEAELGPIDVWVNNAFAGIFAEFVDVSPEEYRRVTEVTYLGQVWGTRAALRYMLPRDRGSVVLVGSALAYRGIPLQSAYCGAKHATQGFLDSVRTELLARRSRVHLTMVQLPGVNTPQFDWVRAKTHGRPRPTGAIYQPEVAARAIRFAAHSRRKEIYVGWPAYEAILGDKAASALADRYLAHGSIDDQQAETPLEKGRKDNLFSPVEGDRGAHGRFGRESRPTSLLLWATMNRRMLGLASAACIGAGAAWWRGRASRRRDR